MNGTNVLHMEQMIKYEILLQLAKEEIHVRALAKKLGINHMAVSRTLKLLIDENAVDYKEKGRNKVYLIKKVLEAKNLLIMAEMYQLNRWIEKYPRLRKIVDAVQKNNNIKLSILFGSYAKGIPKDNSDIDVYIEGKDRKLKEELSLVDSNLSIKIGDFDLDNLLVKEIIKNHVIIKGAERYYGKTGFFD